MVLYTLKKDYKTADISEAQSLVQREFKKGSKVSGIPYKAPGAENTDAVIIDNKFIIPIDLVEEFTDASPAHIEKVIEVQQLISKPLPSIRPYLYGVSIGGAVGLVLAGMLEKPVFWWVVGGGIAGGLACHYMHKEDKGPEEKQAALAKSEKEKQDKKEQQKKDRESKKASAGK